MAKKLTGVNYITRKDGTYMDFNALSEEEKREVSSKLTARFMEALGYGKAEKNEEADAT